MCVLQCSCRIGLKIPEQCFSLTEDFIMCFQMKFVLCVSFLKDSIEANVETAEVHVQQANQQLSRAADYQVNIYIS